MKDKPRYISFALPMVRFIYTKPNALNDIISYGIYRAAMAFQVEEASAYRQLLYVAGRRGLDRKYITTELYDFVCSLDENCEPDELISYYFHGSAFDEDFDLTSELVNKAKEQGEDIHPLVMEWYRLTQAQQVLGLDIEDICHVLYEGRKYNDLYGTGQVPVSVPISLLYDYKKKLRTEYDRVRLATYLAIRSLAGNGVAVTTSMAIMWRTFGARNEEELKATLKDKRLKSIYEKWTSKHYYRLIMSDLTASKLILTTRYGNRTIISASITQPKEFAEAAALKIRGIFAKQKAKQIRDQKANLQMLLNDALNSS